MEQGKEGNRNQQRDYGLSLENTPSTANERRCLACTAVLQGRRDKKFCDSYCRSAYHYKKNREEGESFYVRVKTQLSRNRRLLRKFNRVGKTSLRAEILLKQGFDPRFFTHYWKNKQGQVYLFIFEYGFLARLENGYKKYVLVSWQPYMEKQRARTDR